MAITTPPPPPAPVRPIDPHTGRPAWHRPATVAGVALAATAVIAVGNPNTTHIPLCPLKAVTGLDCPFCGSLRAVYALAHGQIGSALDHNLLFTLSVPALLTAWAIWLARSLGRPVAPRLRMPSWGLTAFLVVAFAFAVVRNIPAFGWLGST